MSLKCTYCLKEIDRSKGVIEHRTRTEVKHYHPKCYEVVMSR
jgi:hypothetical protein